MISVQVIELALQETFSHLYGYSISDRDEFYRFQYLENFEKQE